MIIRSRNARTRVACLSLWALVALLAGCAVDQGDLVRWETTLGGPKRLSAVVVFDKYPLGMRVQAAMSLINMKPRKGKHEGIERLIKGALVCDPEFIKASEPCATTELDPETRANILAELIPLIITELAKKPPPAQKGQVALDPSFKFKDAAFLMLIYEKTQIIADAGLRKQLTSALSSWAMDDFETRLADKNQAYGMEQLLRHIGPASVTGLPKLMTKDSRNLAKMSELVAKIGDRDTREEASKALVEIVKYTASKEWRDEKLPELREANRKAGFDPTEDQLNKQLAEFQVESITRVYASMKQVGGAAVVAYCLGAANDKSLDEKLRQTALAALEGHIDRKNAGQIDALFAVAGSDAPPTVVDQAFRRIKELPRELAAEKLYAFFEAKDWKLRRLAAATILQMSSVKHIDEFMDKLGAKGGKNFNMGEGITYGAYLSSLKEGDPLPALKKHMSSGEAHTRMAAISYYYELGDKTMVAQVDPLENDETKVPACEEGTECDWTCLIGPDDKKEPKEVKSVGDFVRYCIKPKMQKTDPETKKKDDGSKKPAPTDDKLEDKLDEKLDE